MATLSANGLTLTYTTSTTDSGIKITLSSLTKTSNPTTFATRFAKIMIDGKSIVSEEARRTPSISDILKTYNNNGIYTNEQRNQAIIEHKNSLQQNGIAASNALVASFNNKSAAFKTFEYARSTVDKKVIINLYVLGATSAINISIPKKQSDESETIYEDSKSIGIEDVNGGLNYVINESAYNTYGHIERVVNFSDVKDEKQLLSLARAYVNSLQFDDMCMTVSAVDLHTLTGSVPGFGLLDEVRCVSRPHGLNRTFPITEMSIALDDPSKTSYTFGTVNGRSMSESMVDNASNIFKRINKQPSATRLLDAAKLEMSEILNRRTTGYVNIVQENDISQALVISNTPDWTQATKLWKFDMNGLGYSDSTIGNKYSNATSVNADGRLYKIGITMDGTIVADFIKTGLLEDGYGLNYWNLATGEFSLSPNTLISDNILDGSVSNIEDLSDFLEASYTKEIGTKNILRKSDNFSIINKSSKTWNAGGWNTYTSLPGGDKVSIVNSTANGINSVPPAPDLTKAVKLYCVHNGLGSASISQNSIKLSTNTVYTIACYACGTGTLTLRASGYQSRQYSVSINHNDWRRYNFVFKAVSKTDVNASLQTAQSRLSTLNTTKNNAYNAWQNAVNNKESASSIKTKKTTYTNALASWKKQKKIVDTLKITVPLTDSKTVSVKFMNSKIANKTIVVSGLTLVKGNVSNDWSPSESDVFSQIDAFSSALTQKNIINKLTNGGKKEGIFLQSGHLYLNATYMMAGVISDKQGYNKWNLSTGYLTTTSMVAKNIKASGILENTNQWGSYKGETLYDRITINPKGLKFTYKSYMPGKIYSGFDGFITKGSTLGTIQMGASTIYLNSNNIAVVENFTKPVQSSSPASKTKFWNGTTGTLNITGVVQDPHNKKMYQTTIASIRVLHGLVIGLMGYNTYTKKLNYVGSGQGGGTFHPPVNI